ncbi:MAG: endolytic transglycosylase MltG [Pseudomonadota bacterium]
MRHLAANALTVVIVLLVIVSGAIVWGQAQFRAAGPLQEVALVTVEPGDRLDEITEALLTAGAIENDVIFRIGARYRGDDRRLRFGEYEIPPAASMEEVLDIIVSGRSVQYFVTVPEGLTSWEIVQLLNEEPLLTGEIEEIPPEGVLAPDTYSVQRGESRQALLTRMEDAQASILARAWDERVNDLPLDSIEEALILASIIEKETSVPEERRQVASVFVNRLNRGMRLQTDPTVIYGITEGRGSLGRGLRRSELDRPTPYNTYVIRGLPPGPIANPGRASIEAALNPDETPFIFFVADGTGGHAFSVTYEEHQENVRAWRRIERERELNNQ